MSDEPRDSSGDPQAPGEPVTPEETPAGKPEETRAEAAPEAPAEAAPEAPAAPQETAGEVPAEAPEEEGPSEEEAEAAALIEAEAEAEAKAEAAKAKAEAAAKKKAAHEAAEALKEPWERDPKPPEWQEADDDPLAEALREKHGEAIESTRSFAGDLTIEVRRESLGEVCVTLKEEQGYLLPVDACGAHYPDREEGQFEVMGAWEFDTGIQYGTEIEPEDGSIIGTPTFPISPRLIKFMPDIEGVAATALTDVNKIQGQRDRRFV